MNHIAPKSGHGWRQMTAGVLACVLCWAIIIQGLAFALAGARMAAGAAGLGTAAAYEICRHDGGAPPNGTPPAIPVPEPHCAFCLAGSSCVTVDPAPAPEFRRVLMATAPWRFAVWRLPAATVDASARPRGPPSAA